MVQTIAELRTTYINQRTLSIIFLVFSFCLTYFNLHYSMPNQVQWYCTVTHTVPLGSVLPLCLHLYHVFAASYCLVLTMGH